MNGTTLIGNPNFTAIVLNDTGRQVCLALIFVLAIMSAVLCCVVIYAAIRAKVYQEAHDLLIIISAGADFLRAVHGFGLLFLYWWPFRGDVSSGDERFCVTFAWLHYFQYTISAWIMALIAFSRYDLIAHPLHKTLTIRRTLSIVVAIVIEATIFASLPLMGWNQYFLTRTPTVDVQWFCVFADASLNKSHRSFVLVQYILNYLVPYILVIIFYALIVPVALKFRKRNRRRLSVGNIQQNEQRRTSSRKQTVGDLVKTKPFIYITIIIANNIILTSPYIIFACLRNFFKVKVEVYATFPLALIFNLSFAVNSILYCMWIRTIKERIAIYFCFKFCRRGESV
ncbi:rhodopsin-like [Oscarella lobularis]|uniref:rhodopsin-like n=1 Tax=Oscarella lobularis TaxID=121494 RepID=UPI003313C978